MFISSSDFDKDVLSVEGDLGVIRVDNRGERTNGTLGIKNDGVDRGVANDRKELTEMLILL